MDVAPAAACEAHRLPRRLVWVSRSLARRPRTVTRAGVFAVAGLVFLSNLYVPFVTATSLPEQGWQAALAHGFRHRWRAGVDYVFTYGPLGALTTRAFDPAVFPLRLAWEVGLAAVAAGVAVTPLRANRPWRVRLLLVIVLTIGRALAGWECKALLVMAGLVVLLLDRPWPSRKVAAATLGLFAVLALTKFTLFVHAAVLGGIVVTHVAVTRGWRSAAVLTIAVAAWFGLVWMAAGQSLADLPTFVEASRLLADGYAEAMHLDGPRPEVLAAAVGGGLVAVAVGLRPTAGSRSAPILSAVAVGWLLFGHFKGCFVRQEPDRAESFFALLTVLALWLWPAGRARRPVTAALAVVVGLGLYGTVARSDRWAVPSDWLASLRQSVRLLTDPAGRAATLAAEQQTARTSSALPLVAAAVGDRSIDMLTNRPGVVLENGLHWTPRPVFQSYAAVGAELQGRNRDFFRSPAAPDFVLFRGEPIDGRLFTQDDGPAVLELLRRYEPRLREDGYLLLERRPDPHAGTPPGPESLGEPLLDRDVHFGEPIDLAALGPDPKAISFQIEDSNSGRLWGALHHPPTIYLRVTRTNGHTHPYRLTPGMVRDPILIDPLPATVDEYADLFLGRLRPDVASVTLTVDRPGLRRHFVEPIRCSVWSVRDLPAPADSRGDAGD